MKKLKYISGLALLATLVFNSCKKDTVEIEGQTREYFISADETEWDYAPSATNLFSGAAYTPEELVYLTNDTNRIGRKNIKAIYHLYTDASFTTRLSTDDDAELGMLGPVIRAQVGDKIKILFRNNTMFKVSMHPHGVKYDSNNEGIAPVDPGNTFTYEWDVPESACPTSGDLSSVCWMYHSHVMENMEADVYAGLVGPLIIYKKGYLQDNKPLDMDGEKFGFFSVMDENASLYLDSNITRYTSGTVNVADPDFQESNLKHSVNGLMYGNQQYTMKQGENIRWYLITLGNEVDWHTAHWHGNTVEFRNDRTDVIPMGPATMIVADMKVTNVGTWQFHCHVVDHMMAGMDALYTVQ